MTVFEVKQNLFTIHPLRNLVPFSNPGRAALMGLLVPLHECIRDMQQGPNAYMYVATEDAPAEEP